MTVDIMNHWIKFVHTQTRKGVQSCLTTHLEKLRHFKNYLECKKKDKYWKEYDDFVSVRIELFDIIVSNDRIKSVRLKG